MKTLKVILAYISSCKIWLIALACANVLFIFFAWFAYPEEFYSLIWLMISVSIGTSFIPLFILVKRHHKLQTVFHHFLTEPDEANEYALCEAAPISMHPFIHELGDNLRSRQAEIDNSGVQLADYESYIENWVHEIKEKKNCRPLFILVCSMYATTYGKMWNKFFTFPDWGQLTRIIIGNRFPFSLSAKRPFPTIRLCWKKRDLRLIFGDMMLLTIGHGGKNKWYII